MKWGGESSKKSHTHSLIVTKTGNKRGKENKKPAHPALGMRVWRFWHEFCYVCVACPIPTRLCYTQPKFGCRGKVCLFSFSPSFRESLEAYHDVFLGFFFLLLTFPFVNSICIPFGDRKCLRFWYVCPRGEVGGSCADYFFLFFLYPWVHQSLSVCVELPPWASSWKRGEKTITNDETKEGRLLSLLKFARYSFYTNAIGPSLFHHYLLPPFFLFFNFSLQTNNIKRERKMMAGICPQMRDSVRIRITFYSLRHPLIPTQRAS